MESKDILMPIGYIAIPVEEYVDLIETNDRYDTLLSVLYDNSCLSWNGKSLAFDDEAVSTVLCVIHNRYHKLLKKFQDERAEIEKEKEAENEQSDND
jgi:hypothetical protein